MKIIYQQIYVFNVEDEIASGQDVHVLDKSNGSTELINDMTVRRACEIIEEARTSERYYFWTRNLNKED